MADDRKIRVILEGIDNLSKILKKGEQNMQVFGARSSKNIRNLNSDVDDTRHSLAELVNDRVVQHLGLFVDDETLMAPDALHPHGQHILQNRSG